MSRPRKAPSQQRSRFTYDTILEAATRVFDREGIAATTNRIAGEAGVSVGSLYQYFPNKQAILHELALRHLDHAEAAFTATLRHLHACRSPLPEVVTELIALAVRENGPLARAYQLLRDHAPRTAELEHRFRRFIEVLVDSLAVFVPEGDSEQGRLRLRMVVAALDSQIHHVILDAPTPEEREARTIVAVEQTMSALRGTG